MEEAALTGLKERIQGDLYWDEGMRILYATDASAYREKPLAIAIPKTKTDLAALIAFAQSQACALIPRTAGTSLAGQVVGAGLVVDLSKHFTEIIELNTAESWVRVQAGVIRDDLNRFLKNHGLYFGPETSTANRAMIGGMVGNNSCGSNSLIYQSTREHTLAIEAFLSDGSLVTLEALTFEEFTEKCSLTTLEGSLYRHMRQMLSNYENQVEIRKEFPKPNIPRRNTGYALDLLLESDPFTAGKEKFNFCKLICGSEGTLAFITEIKLHLSPLPTKPSALLCVHFESLDDALKGNLIALQHGPLVVELMDHYILECTKSNRAQRENSFFVQGDPKALLIVEYDGDSLAAIATKMAAVVTDLQAQKLGYHFPIVYEADKNRVWALRKAGLGLLSNMPGDEKPVAVIEDTAVDVVDLPQYIQAFNAVLQKHGLYSVHYAHAATGELHLRPILNLKTKEGNALFRTIALEIAHLVKQYGGSLSGEHGDGRLRGEFIPIMLGPKNYELLKSVKQQWDPQGIFNPGKIVNTPPMNSQLRYTPDHPKRQVKSVFRYADQDLLQHAEQCNGSGDCRKSHLAGGTMCPSYMATKNEQDSTRARANMLREMLTHSDKENPFDHQEIKAVMDLCLSCKACKSECPSSVDMAKLKADFLQQYYDSNGVPLRSRMLGHVDEMTRLMAHIPRLYNWVISNSLTSKWVKGILGFAQQRELPPIAPMSLRSWFSKHQQKNVNGNKGSVYFFFDEFTNFTEVELGKKAILLLEALGYTVLMVDHAFSGRALFSKGLLREARKLANRNVALFADLLSADRPLVGVEPSTILTFRDEYVDIVDVALIDKAKRLSPYTLTLEEFFVQEFNNGNLKSDAFTDKPKDILLHSHCQQKAWGLEPTIIKALSIPTGYRVEAIASGCCGMAGSFGYEKEHYALSQQIGELVLFPHIRAKKSPQTCVAAPGTSCRTQIMDALAEEAQHPVELLYAALK